MNKLRKNLLSFGFVREYCNSNQIEFPPDDIVELVTLWISFCDRFDADLCNKNIEILQKHDAIYGEYEQLKISSILFATAICKSIHSKGDKYSWTFQMGVRREVVLGIIDHEKVILSRNGGSISDFSTMKGGIGLYLYTMQKYEYNYAGSTGYFPYGDQFKLKKGDMITMELNLTEEKGKLSFTFHASLKQDSAEKISNNILNVEISVNKQWRAAIAIHHKNSVSLLPYDP